MINVRTDLVIEAREIYKSNHKDEGDIEEIDDNELSELLEEYINEKIEVDYGEI